MPHIVLEDNVFDMIYTGLYKNLILSNVLKLTGC